jgi:hypothetical protein
VAALTPDLFNLKEKSLHAVNAILKALRKGAVAKLDLLSLKAAGVDLAIAQSAGYTDVPSLVAAFGLQSVAVSGHDVSYIHVSSVPALMLARTLS